MRLFIFVVRDRATDSYGNPMFLVSSGQAIRGFTDEINRADRENMMYSHPDDFDLYELGSFETDTGLFTTSSPEMVCIGKNVKIRS